MVGTGEFGACSNCYSLYILHSAASYQNLYNTKPAIMAIKPTEETSTRYEIKIPHFVWNLIIFSLDWMGFSIRICFTHNSVPTIRRVYVYVYVYVWLMVDLNYNHTLIWLYTERVSKCPSQDQLKIITSKPSQIPNPKCQLNYCLEFT